MLSEQEQAQRQRRAYENRDSILPGDVLYMTCSEADSQYARFDLPGGMLTISQSGSEIIRKCERVKITCTRQIIEANGYGLFVNYEFAVYETGGSVIINGPDAQSLVREARAVEVKNRDIPTLAAVLGMLQTVGKTEEMAQRQRDIMLKITAAFGGTPGGGERRGLDSAVATLDELEGELQRGVAAYARTLREAERILNGIESPTMRAFVLLKYVTGARDAEVRRVLGLTRRGFARAVRAVQDAEDMKSVRWQERYICEREA